MNRDEIEKLVEKKVDAAVDRVKKSHCTTLWVAAILAVAIIVGRVFL